MIIETSQIVPVAKGIKLNNIVNYFIGLVKLYFYQIARKTSPFMAGI